MWKNGAGFPPPRVLAGALRGTVAALHLEVNVLQGDAMARGVLAAAQLDGVLGDGRPPDVPEDHVADLHRRSLLSARLRLVAVVLVDDDRVLDAAHDHVLERDVPGVPTSSLVGLDACSVGRAVQLHRVDGDAGDFSSRVVIPQASYADSVTRSTHNF